MQPILVGAVCLTLASAACTGRDPNTGMSGVVQAGTGVAVAGLQAIVDRAGRSSNKLTFNLEPAFGAEPIRIVRRIEVSVDPMLENGTHCYTCVVNWRSDKPGVATWADLRQDGTRRFATVDPLASGTVTLTIEICPRAYFDCEHQDYHVTADR